MTHIAVAEPAETTWINGRLYYSAAAFERMLVDRDRWQRIARDRLRTLKAERKARGE